MMTYLVITEIGVIDVDMFQMNLSTQSVGTVIIAQNKLLLGSPQIVCLLINY